jgi:hypothetical protein
MAIAALPNSVNRAMKQMSQCKQSPQNTTSISCMKDNNAQIKRDLEQLRSRKLAQFSSNRRGELKKKIESKIVENLKKCLYEKTQYQDVQQADKRHQYCIYEHMVEMLITIDRNVEQYQR